MLCCGVVTHSTPWRRATDLRLCNGSVMQMTVYTLNAVLCIQLCSACLLLDSKHTATQHLSLHTFLVQQWRKHQLPVHYLSAFHARTEHACQSHCNIFRRDVASGIHLSGQRVLQFACSRDGLTRLTALEKVLSQALLSRKAFLCSDLKIEKIMLQKSEKWNYSKDRLSLDTAMSDI